MKRFAAAALFLASLTALLGWILHERDRQGVPYALPPPPLVAPEAIDALYGHVLSDLQGKNQVLSQWRGRVLIVNFWASWCIPCRREMPMLSVLHERLKSREVQVVGIAADTPDKAREYADAVPVAYPLWVGGAEVIRLTRPFGNEPQAVPFTLILDREGKLRAAVLGGVHEEPLLELLARLI